MILVSAESNNAQEVDVVTRNEEIWEKLSNLNIHPEYK